MNKRQAKEDAQYLLNTSVQDAKSSAMHRSLEGLEEALRVAQAEGRVSLANVLRTEIRKREKGKKQ